MNAVTYRVTVHREELPNKYIGSKSNCLFENGRLIDREGKEYFGSSTDEAFVSIVATFGYTIEVISVHNDYPSANRAERELHIEYDVVASPEYFNKIIALESNYADPNYATYKNLATGKVARLQRNHPRVLNGEWVGVTKGISVRHDGNKPRFGEENWFYGKHHTQETKAVIANKISEATKGVAKSDSHREAISKSLTGLSKTEEHVKKLKGLIMLQHTETGEIIRVQRNRLGVEFDPNVWVNPKKITPEKREHCIHCGKESVKGNIVRWHNDNCKKKVL